MLGVGLLACGIEITHGARDGARLIFPTRSYPSVALQLLDGGDSSRPDARV